MLGQKTFWSKKNIGLKNIGSKKSFGSKKFGPKRFWSNKIRGPKFVWAQNNFESKKKMLVQNNVWGKIVGPKKMLGLSCAKLSSY